MLLDRRGIVVRSELKRDKTSIRIFHALTVFFTSMLILTFSSLALIDFAHGMPISRQRYSIHFQRNSNQRWISIMNLRVNFDKSIDFPNEDENSAKADTDFDDMEEEIVIMVTPQPLLQNVESTQIAQALPTTTHPVETQRQRNFTETIHFETVQYVDRAVSERYEQSVEVEQLSFLPHEIRLHHHHHKLISTTTSPLPTLDSEPSPGEAVTEGAFSVYDRSTTDSIAGSSEGYGIINVDDEDYADGGVGALFASTFSHGISEATEELSENTYTISISGTGNEEAQTFSSIVKVDDNNTMETATSTSAESLTEEMSADVLNTSSTPEFIRVEGDEEVNECGFTNGSSDEEEECLLLNSNVTSLSRNDSFNQTLKEEEFFFLAKEILHNDSLHRDRETLRNLLGNISHLENFKDFGSMHRDYGGSFLLPLLKAINYNNNSVPIVFSDLPVNVKVSLNIVHLTNFDSQNMDYTVDLEMNMRWYDVRLANNYTKPIRIRESYILDQIWKPDPYFNSKYSYFHTVSFPNFRMRLMPDGMVHYTLRVTLMPICLMTFCRHPHDSQKCDLIISSVAYTNSVVNFIWDEVEPVRFSTKVSLPELRNKQIVTESCVVEGKLSLCASRKRSSNKPKKCFSL